MGLNKNLSMRFYKYHGTGNDFIIIDNRNESIREAGKGELAKELCDRHFGIGGDGLILAETSSRADGRMRIFNPDGSEAEMCGNGVRCMGKFLYETGTQKERLLIETIAGIKEVSLTIERGEVAYLTVEMGSPKDTALDKRLGLDGKVWEYSFIDTGVPHVVIFVDDLESVDVTGVAPAVRFNPVFPKGTNVNFVEKIKERAFKIRTYERGVERETLACGTGISASGVAAVFLGIAPDDEELEFQARGGTVFVRLVKENTNVKVFITGPAKFVFEGEVAVKPS
jgi:diaminopimelate epimerase